MTSRKRRAGSRKWKRSGHKTREWLINQFGRTGISMWERNGRM